MLSICIPIYNFDVRPLVAALGKQMNTMSHELELILIDDASDIRYKELNESSCNPYNYIKLPTNIGRASIRNLFLEYARFPNLLFLDCDSLIIDDDFLMNYIKKIESSEEPIICGGRVYQSEAPGKNKMLRWKYGYRKESQPAEVRKQAPNHSFMTNNFVVKKHLLEKIRFDERLKAYGHEDTLFGYELLKANIRISHINNPVDNGDIEDNQLFLEKTEKGLENLALINEYMHHDPQLIDMVKLLRTAKKVESLKMQWLVLLIFNILKKPMRYTFLHGLISLLIFDFYKLGYYLKIASQQRN